MSKIIKKLQKENSMCVDCMGNFLKSVEGFTGKCQNCNEYYENETNDYCERCGEYFDDFYNVSEEGEDKDEQIRDWIETWHYDHKGLVRPEVMASALNISLYEAQDWIERWQESEADFRMNDSGSAEDDKKYFDGLIDDWAMKDLDKESWGSWADNDVMTSDDQVKLMKDLGIADKTLRDMGYYKELNESTASEVTSCPTCNGTGEINADGGIWKCERCGGTGTLDGIPKSDGGIESKASESFHDYFDHEDDDTIVCTLCKKQFQPQNFGQEEGSEHLFWEHDISDPWQMNESKATEDSDLPAGWSQDQIDLFYDDGDDEEPHDDSDDLYELMRDRQQDEEEEREKESNEESKASELSTIDRLRAWQKREDEEWNSLSKEEQDKIHNDYEDEVEAEWNNMSEEERKSYESAGQDFDENDDDDSEDIDNNFQKADANPEKKITLSEDEMLNKSSESYKALTDNPHIQLNF